MIKKLTNTSFKTDKNEEQLTEISSKLSNYKDSLKKLSFKDTQIQPFSLHTKKLTDTSSKTDKREE